MKNQTTLLDDQPVHGDGRDTFDRYYTPEWATQALVDYLGSRLSGTVWEPACGADWIGRVLRASGRIERYIGTDLDPDSTRIYWYPAVTGLMELPTKVWQTRNAGRLFDFLRQSQTTHSPDWIITNPPYATPTGSATDFVRRALRYRDESGGRVSVAMLMRVGWLEPCADRVDILTGNPPTDVLVLPRVHYIGAGKSNNQTSCWYIWDGDNNGNTQLKVLA